MIVPSTVRSARRTGVLRPGGTAVFSVPAFDVLRGEHAVFAHERRRYTRPGLRALLDSAGFRIERLTCTNATLFVPLLLRRTWQRTRGLPQPEQARSDFRLPPAAVNRPARRVALVGGHGRGTYGPADRQHDSLSRQKAAAGRGRERPMSEPTRFARSLR